MKKIYIFLLSLACIHAAAQNAPAKLKLYFDCTQAVCDFNFIRQEIPVADFVRDRRESDIHILVSSHGAANGGEKYDILFLGQDQWANKNDSLYFFTQPNSSQDVVRKQLVKVIYAGIAAYLVKTGQIDQLNFSVINDNKKAALPVKDKWDNWVFSIGGRARFSGDKNYKEKNLAYNGTAARVTETSKLTLSFFNSSARNTYIIDDNGQKSSLITINDYREVEQEYVRSISSKWSWAFETAFRKSTYNNLKSSLSAAAGIEYNIFPYKLSSSKFFALRAMLEANKRNYLEETIFYKRRETLYSANLGAYIYFTQPWGNISSSVTWYNYLHDVSKNNLSMDANLDLKLFKGVSINFYATGSLINDQLSLAREGASSQEVLLRLKALATNFNYYTGIGINYKFGSKFNNYVNPRFTDGRY